MTTQCTSKERMTIVYFQRKDDHTVYFKRKDDHTVYFQRKDDHSVLPKKG